MGRVLPSFLAILVFTAVAALPAAAENPPTLRGWIHGDPERNGGSGQHGLAIPGNDVQYSSPAVAEIDGDTGNGLETVVASSDGTVAAFKSDGTLMWSAEAPNKVCNGSSATNKMYSSPAVGAIYGDGIPYVVVGYGGIGTRACDGGIIAINARTGEIRWSFSLGAFAKKEKFWTMSNTVFSTPALADTDGDGKMEIGFGSFDRNVYLLNYDGSVRWYYNAADSVWSSPIFVNVDSDPALEMVIGTDISRNDRIKPRTKNGGFVYAFKTQPRKNKHIYFRDRTAYLWQTFIPQVIYSAPIVADVLPSPGLEVVVGSGCFFPQNTNMKGGRFLKILRLSTGKVLQTLNAPGCVASSPAVGDIEGRGTLNIVATVNGDQSVGGDGKSRLVAWRPENPEPIWSVIPRDRGNNDPFGGNFQSPAIADLDGNGSREVVVANLAAVGIFNGADGSALTCQVRGCDGTSTYTLFATKGLKSTPTVADVDGDGELDVVIGGGGNGTNGAGVLYGWTGFKEFLESPAGSLAPFSAPWPTYRGNASRSGQSP